MVGHEPRGEFKARPERISDKGSGAQHRQAVSPDGPSPCLSGVFIKTICVIDPAIFRPNSPKTIKKPPPQEWLLTRRASAFLFGACLRVLLATDVDGGDTALADFGDLEAQAVGLHHGADLGQGVQALQQETSH